MKRYKIYAGLGGGFGGANYQETKLFNSDSKAENYAWELASDIYESYVGLHGLRGIEEIIEEDGVSSEEAYCIYDEEKESWLDYWAEEVE
jgi:hypothetical protein